MGCGPSFNSREIDDFGDYNNSPRPNVSIINPTGEPIDSARVQRVVRYADKQNAKASKSSKELDRERRKKMGAEWIGE